MEPGHWCGKLGREVTEAKEERRLGPGNPTCGKMEPAVGEAGGDIGKSWRQKEEGPAHTDPFFSRLRDG